MPQTNQAIGIQYNKLLRYKQIMDIYKQYDDGDRATTVIWRKYIRPIYPISRTTLYTILCTPVNKELAELEALINQQTKFKLN